MPLKVKNTNNTITIFNPNNNTSGTIQHGIVRSSTQTQRNKPIQQTTNSRFKVIAIKELNQDSSRFDPKEYLKNAGFAHSSKNFGRYPQLPFRENLRTYGVFIDPDLYPTDAPIYVFQSPDNRMRCYIVNHGLDKNYWSAHIVHTIAIHKDNFGLDLIFWRIVTIDRDSPEGISGQYILDSALDICGVRLEPDEPVPPFDQNIGYSRLYDISNITYAGGGLFTGYNMDFLNDGQPVMGTVGFFSRGNYVNFSGENLILPNGNAVVEIYRNISPTSFFSWIRGVLTISKDVEKEAIYQRNNDIKDHISINFNSSYRINLTLVPENYMGQKNAIVHNEYCNSNAVIIQNTNYRLDSRRRFFDFGTFHALNVFREYRQESNCIRQFPDSTLINHNKRTIQNYLCFPFLGADNYAQNLLYITSDGTGSIRHKSIVVKDSGFRGVSFSWVQRFWFAFGEILSVKVHTGGQLTIVSAIQGNPPISALAVLQQIGTPPFYRIDPNQTNRIELLWDTPRTPPTFFGGWAMGMIPFDFEYMRPPFFQHNGIYYYEDNPLILNDAGGDSRSDNIAPSGVLINQHFSHMARFNTFGDARLNSAAMNRAFDQIHGGWWAFSQGGSQILNPTPNYVPRRF